jgi:hypothetical protein
MAGRFRARDWGPVSGRESWKRRWERDRVRGSQARRERRSEKSLVIAPQDFREFLGSFDADRPFVMLNFG